MDMGCIQYGGVRREGDKFFERDGVDPGSGLRPLGMTVFEIVTPGLTRGPHVTMLIS